MSTNRDDLHQLVDQIPDSKLVEAERRLKRLIEATKTWSDPVKKAIDAAPIDDEPITEEERERIRRADEDFKEGRTLSMDEVKRELDL